MVFKQPLFARRRKLPRPYLKCLRCGAPAVIHSIRATANLYPAYVRAGKRERAQTILKQLQTTDKYVSPGELAVLYAALGEREQAFASLEKAYAAHDLQVQYLGVDPAFDSLRSDPRFQDLMRCVGLSE